MPVKVKDKKALNRMLKKRKQIVLTAVNWDRLTYDIEQLIDDAIEDKGWSILPADWCAWLAAVIIKKVKKTLKVPIHSSKKN